VRAYDGDAAEWFSLKASLCLVTGDRMALQKLMALAGPNGKCPCPYCHIKGIWSPRGRHYYYPLQSPNDSELVRPRAYDPYRLPMRSNLKQLIYRVCASEEENMYKESGVAGLSIFMELDSILWPQSFCVDTMHLVLENLMPLMYKLWCGGFQPKPAAGNTDPPPIPPDYVLSKNVWEEIGYEMDKSRSTIPTSFARAPRSIFRHSAGYKAVE